MPQYGIRALSLYSQRWQAAGEPNIIKKIFAMPLIGGAKGVELSDDYKL